MGTKTNGWFACYRIDTGDLVSVSTIQTDPLPAGLAFVTLPREPDWSRDSWDPVQHSLVPRTANGVPRDRIAEAEADISADLTLSALTVLQRDHLSAILQSRFGDVKAA